MLKSNFIQVYLSSTVAAFRGEIQPNIPEFVRSPVLNQMVEIIVAAVQPEKIILFGSHARGTAKVSSDYDFLVVNAKPFDESRSRYKEISKISRALARLRIATDVLLHSTDEVEQWKHSLNHVIGRAVREGVVLYERH